MADISIQLAIPEDSNFELLLNDPIQFSKLLDTDQQRLMDDHVVGQLDDQDGAPTLTDFSISNLLFDRTTLKGSFRLHFKISRQFCCSDSSSCQTDYIDFNFTKEYKKIYATGSYTIWTIQ
jgi:hypothetical protein